MVSKKLRIAVLLWAGVFFPLVVFTVQQPEDMLLFQSEKKIVVDGNLGDWEGIREIPVAYSPDGQKKSPSADITVTAKLTYDSRNFYVAVKTVDDVLEFPDRSWRYGDGLHVTFIDVSQGDQSYQFYTFGFSKKGKEVVKLVVNKDGTYFPMQQVVDVQAEVGLDKTQNTLTYEIAIPFKYILPFKPFFHDEMGINLIYVDNDRTEQEVLQLYPDPDYDSEMTSLRRAAVFKVMNHSPEIPEFQTLMKTSHYYHDAGKTVVTAVNSPVDEDGWKIRYELSSASISDSAIQEITLKKGMNFFSYSLAKREYPSGLYDLSLGVLDPKGSLKFSDNNTFYIVNRGEFEKVVSAVAKAREGDAFSKDKVLKSSFPTVEIRLEWYREFMEKALPFADFNLLERWSQELEFLMGNIEQGKPALFLNGRIGRLAHRSKIDGSLQPYSVFIPEDYDGKKPLPLLITLHGSGVDEENHIYSVARAYLETRLRAKGGKMIILAPKARGLSDWYLGESAEDVFECIDHVKTVYNIDEKRIILDGFSMGGYGAWRLILLYPEKFRAAVIRSGAVQAPDYVKGEKITDLVEKGKGKEFFIVHGSEDKVAPVEKVREVVKKMKELKIRNRYLEVKKAGHGDYNKWTDIFSWLFGVLDFGAF